MNLLIVFGVVQTMAVANEVIDFTRDIRPILSNACFHCHGPDEGARQADLRLDQRDSLFGETDGRRIVVPGEPESSELVQRILSHDTDEVMPPPDSNKTVTEQQRRKLVDWVKQGADWQQHWAFELPTAGKIPSVINKNWCRNDVDRFVLSRIELAGLQPSAQAAPHTLLRRIYLDLIGLPPTIEEADKWLERIWGADQKTPLNEEQWQLLIDELMASPHYGERWARRWLDLARYADTNGYEKDRDRSIWPYRDWVVNAINEDMPFDRFTVEQLAGDMLPNATQAQRVATGFHRNTMLNEEGGIDPLEFRYHAVTDRVATTGTTWLGLTLGCCQCHTHKYDPVSHHEYFQMFAFLNNADEPYLELSNPKSKERSDTNQQKARKLLEQLPHQWPVNGEFVSSGLVSATADGSQEVKIAANDTVLVSGDNPETATYVVELRPKAEFDSLKLIARSTGDRPGPGRTAHGNFVLSEIQVEAVMADQKSQQIPIVDGMASVEQDDHSVKTAFDARPNTGWAIHSGRKVPRQATATFDLNVQDVDFSAVDRIRVTLIQSGPPKHTIGEFSLQLHRGLEPKQLASVRATQVEAAFDAWIETEQTNAVAWTPMIPTKATSNLPILTIQDDHSIFASGDTAKRDDYVITLAASDKPITAIRLEALPDERLPAGGPGSTYYEGTIGDFYLTELTAKTTAGIKFPFASATHSYAKNRYGNNPASAALSIDGDIQTGWSVHDRLGERHVAVYVLEQPIPTRTSVRIDMAFGRHFASSLGRFRFSATDVKSAPIAKEWSDDVERLLTIPREHWNDAQRAMAFTTFLMASPQLSDAAKRIRQLQKTAGQTTSLVFTERPEGHGRPTFRHHRGEYLQPKDRVEASLPQVLQQGGAAPGNRLEFARWLVSKQNPLTARVVVNRHWATLFGTGIVKTVDDFGLQGDYPSHPLLLDWLAVKFSTDDAWSVRKLHRLITSSATYRQSSRVNADTARGDPDNRLLSYSPRYRLDAEIIRDQLLVAADVLSPKLGGPPVRPPQPDGVTEAAYGKPKWNASSGSDRYRRSLYTYTKRTAPFAMFSTFDAPSGEACIARRTRSNSPLQALTMLNDVMLLDLAQQTGQKLAKNSFQASDKVVRIFRRLLVRPPTEEELASVLHFQMQKESDFRSNPEAAADMLVAELSEAGANDLAAQASWTAVARALFGLDETLTRE